MGSPITISPLNISSNIEEFNRTFFPMYQSEKAIEELDDKIAMARADLLNLIMQRDTLVNTPIKSQKITKEAVQNFFDRYPGMYITYDDDSLRLVSSKHSVSFHTERSIDNPCNDNIIYTTFPLYGFYFNFLSNGRVMGGRSNDFYPHTKIVELLKQYYFNDETESGGSNTRHKLFEIDSHGYGHPNALMYSEKSKEFGAVCTGNNKFREAYKDACEAGNSRNSAFILSILSRAAVWMVTANLADMYSTNLSPEYIIPSALDKSIKDKDFVDEFFKLTLRDIPVDKLTVTTGEAQAICDILHAKYNKENHLPGDPWYFLYRVGSLWIDGQFSSPTGLSFLQKCAYTLWMYNHWFSVFANRSLLARKCFHTAIIADILFMFCKNPTSLLSEPTMVQMYKSSWFAPKELKLTLTSNNFVQSHVTF